MTGAEIVSGFMARYRAGERPAQFEIKAEDVDGMAAHYADMVTIHVPKEAIEDMARGIRDGQFLLFGIPVRVVAQ